MLHEIGHFLYKGDVSDSLSKELFCDQFSKEIIGLSSLVSALKKTRDIQSGATYDEMTLRINKLLLFYRPEWTVGRYNKEKHVAIMYNLIAGYSFFFENFSADVIDYILKSGRNGKINIDDVVKGTGISETSILSFLELLNQHGLVTESVPTKEEIAFYRRAIVCQREHQPSWFDQETKEKVPVWTSNAEQNYYDAIDDGETICSCMFELTYRCSEMCIHCYNPGATRNNEEKSYRADQKELTLEEYKQIIDELNTLGLVKVCLSGGDPFSKEFIWELIDYLYEKEIAFDIFTNGQRLIKDVKRLADYYPRLIGISLYSGIPEDHDAITRIPGSWEKSMEVVKQMSELAISMNLKCCVMQPNLHSYYMVADLAKIYHAQPQFELNITESNDGDQCAKQLRLNEEQLRIVLRDNNLALYVGKELPNYGSAKRDLSETSCGAGRTGFCVSPNGDFRLCPSFTQVYGNLKEQSALSILMESPELAKWRNAVLSDFTECGRHDYCDYCNLCAGINYLEHGDFRKPAETNCFMAKCRYNLANQLRNIDEPINRTQLVEALQKLPKAKVELRRMYHNKG